MSLLMPFYDFNRRIVKVNIQKYRIDWDKSSCSNLQTQVKEFLEDFWKYKKVLEEFRIPKTKLRIDFLNVTDKIAVEANGEQHDKFVPHFHKNLSGFLEHCGRDRKKEDWLEKNGYKLIEIYQSDIKNLSKESIFELYGIEL